MEDLTPRQRRHLRTKDAILDAARRIISEEGVDKLSMRGIADRIDYSAAGLYEYFGGKDEIITAVCLQGDERLRQSMGNVDTSLPPMAYLIEIGLAYIDFAVTHPDHFMLMFSSGLEPPAERQDTETVETSFDVLVDAIARGIEAGDFISREGFGLMEMAFMAWSIVHGIAVLRVTQFALLPYDFSDADREVLRTAVYGLSQPP
jgi:AcrR family transcriptional regulator